MQSPRHHKASRWGYGAVTGQPMAPWPYLVALVSKGLHARGLPPGFPPRPPGSALAGSAGAQACPLMTQPPLPAVQSAEGARVSGGRGDSRGHVVAEGARAAEGARTRRANAAQTRRKRGANGRKRDAQGGGGGDGRRGCATRDGAQHALYAPADKTRKFCHLPQSALQC